MRSPLLLAVIFVAACGGGNNNPSDSGGGDAPPDGPPQTEVVCEALQPLPSGVCAVTGNGTSTLLKGTVLTPTTVYKGGQVAFDSTGQISCVGCNCAQGGETTITCPDGAISPGLINTHD